MKINKIFSFNEEISLNEFIDNEISNNNENDSFYLFSIVVHSGFYNTGHYYLIIKDFNNNKYYKINDKNIFKENKSYNLIKTII